MTILEVEQKFALNVALLARFRLNAGSPPFRSLEFLRNSSFTDAYYDHNNRLSSHGLWIRKRNSCWGAKYRLSGSYLQSTFHETSEVDEIKALVEKYRRPESGREGEGPETNFGLREICQYRTDREEWVGDERFTIALDRTDFGYAVGEVEVEARKDETEEMHTEIMHFMNKYKWFFVNQREIKGKMTAYFEKFGFPPSD